jgi:surfeit locus 1 family protein
VKRRLLTALVLLFAAGFVALGVWQVERRAWKHELIAAVDARIHRAPVAAPGPAEWPRISASRDAYRRISATGRFRHDRETLVQAVTTRGAGYWVLTPLETPRFTLLINRGFVPTERRAAAARVAGNPAGMVTVTGLLRVSEPGGACLRSNDPAADRWYSRDVAEMARARGLGRVAPYFLDADATPNRGGYPVGGLTVVHFRDPHLVYALTWFALAALSLFFARLLWRPARLRSNRDA